MMNRCVPLALTASIALSFGCNSGVEQDFTGSGTFEAKEILVSAQSTGELLEISFDEGDNITQGLTLAEIDAESLRLQHDVTASSLDELSWKEKIAEREISAAEETVNQAQASLEILTKTHDRIQNLFGQGAATRDRLDKIETELAVAVSQVKAADSRLSGIRAKLGSLKAARETINARLRLLDHQISMSMVTSPGDGIVIEKFAECGEFVAIGVPICSIADVKSMWLTIYVGGEMLGKIKIGTVADIYIDSHPDQVFKGKVSWISQEAEFTPKNVQTKESRVDLVYAVKISVDNRKGIFKIGMPADAHIVSQ